MDICHFDRSGVSGGGNKSDPMPSPAGSAARVTFKNEQEKSMLSRDVSGGPIKERPLGKVNVKYVLSFVKYVCLFYIVDIVNTRIHKDLYLPCRFCDHYPKSGFIYLLFLLPELEFIGRHFCCSSF